LSSTSFLRGESGQLIQHSKRLPGRARAIKHIHVTCAIIRRGSLVLAARRSAVMSMPLKWEFPGGKIRDDETAEECLSRELKEELGIIVHVGVALAPSTHQYPDFTITLYPFLCGIQSGAVTLHEHAEIAWVKPQRLSELDWADADRPVVEAFLKMTAEDAE
jgi:8-oxo-dGTP diphosphatase